MTKWVKSVKVLWGIIVVLLGGLATCISFVWSLGDTVIDMEREINSLNAELDAFQQEYNGFFIRHKTWRWDIEDALKHADLIYFEAGILKPKGD